MYCILNWRNLNDENSNFKMTVSHLSGKEFTERLNTITDARLADQKFGVSELARELDMSRSTLHRKVREAFHESANQYISHKRLERSR